MRLLFTKFWKEDFPEYKSWYKDAQLNMHLGPMDNKWLGHVMKETDGCQYSVMRENELIAVVGIKFPDAKHSAYYITDFAVKPSLHSIGIGTKVLHELIQRHPLKPGQTWKAFIDVKNTKAKIFFECLNLNLRTKKAFVYCLSFL